MSINRLFHVGRVSVVELSDFDIVVYFSDMTPSHALYVFAREYVFFSCPSPLFPSSQYPFSQSVIASNHVIYYYCIRRKVSIAHSRNKLLSLVCPDDDSHYIEINWKIICICYMYMYYIIRCISCDVSVKRNGNFKPITYNSAGPFSLSPFFPPTLPARAAAPHCRSNYTQLLIFSELENVEGVRFYSVKLLGFMYSPCCLFHLSIYRCQPSLRLVKSSILPQRHSVRHSNHDDSFIYYFLFVTVNLIFP